MNTNDQKNGDHLKENIEKLLAHAEPTLTMPEASKAKVLSKLMNATPEAPSVLKFTLRKGMTMMRSRRTPWATAIAAVVVLSVIGFWPGGSQDGVAWADVVQWLSEIESVSGLATIEEVSTSGTRTFHTSRFFYKDPGMSRTE